MTVATYDELLEAYEKLGRDVVFGRAALNRMINNEWGWSETEGGDVYPRNMEHSCRLAQGGPSCSTCSDFSLIVEGWAALNGKDWD